MSPRTRLAVAAVAVLASSTAVVVTQTGDGSAHPTARAVDARSSAMVTAQRAGILPATATPTPAWSGYASKPNILMITADDMAAGDLRYMPHVKKLLEQQGVTFSDAIAPTPICVPARASLLSGQYAHNDNDRTISGPHGGYTSFNERKTLPIALQRAGYDTLFTGKYINGYGLGGSRHTVPPGWTDWRATVDPSTYNFMGPRVNHNGKLTKYHRYTTYVMSDQANQMLTKKRRQHHKWFMWINYVAPHFGGPTQKDDPARVFRGTSAAKIKTTVPAPQDRGKFKHLTLPNVPNMLKTPAHVPWDSPSRHHWNATERKALRIEYRQRIQALQGVDRAVARSIATLRKTHQLKKTIVIFASDNGYAVGNHNLGGKLWHYNEIERIPVLMRGPQIPRGRTVATTVTNPDLATTIMAAAGAKPLRPQDGVNILPWLTAPKQERVVPIEGWPVHNGTRRLYVGVRVGPWTYIRYTKGGEELYDRATDPYEIDSLATTPKYHSQLVALRQLTARYADCKGSSCPKQFYRP